MITESWRTPTEAQRQHTYGRVFPMDRPEGEYGIITGPLIIVSSIGSIAAAVALGVMLWGGV